MKSTILILMTALSSMLNTQSFKKEQLCFERVREAYEQKEKWITVKCEELDVDIYNMEIFIRALKKEELLQVWIKNTYDPEYKKFKEYGFTGTSGGLGPKRKQGDFQIPEGVYYIDRFNPASLFHLSLGINYPNASDIASSKPPYGGDIFIHGDEQTIGCIPIGDDLIKELYILALEAKNSGQGKIPVHIFPCAISKDGIKVLEKMAKPDAKTKALWSNLKDVFVYFEKHKHPGIISIRTNGEYVVN